MTLIDPGYKPVSGRRTIDGVLFRSYRMGIGSYCQITEDGKIRTWQNSRMTAWHSEVFGYGTIWSERTGKTKRFQTFEAAARAALKIHKEYSDPV